MRVDIKIAGATVETARIDGEPGIELISFHKRLW